jgi:hypothetical protein
MNSRISLICESEKLIDLIVIWIMNSKLDQRVYDSKLLESLDFKEVKLYIDNTGLDLNFAEFIEIFPISVIFHLDKVQIW